MDNSWLCSSNLNIKDSSMRLHSLHKLFSEVPDLEGGEPLQRGDISYFSLLLMMEALARDSFKTFMEYYAPTMNFEVSYDDYHEFKLAIGKVLEDNKNITSDNFLDVEEPELADDDPETPLPDHQWQGRVDPNTRALSKV